MNKVAMISFFLILSLAGCKTMSSRTKGVAVATSQGENEKTYTFYYLDPIDQNKVCVSRCSSTSQLADPPSVISSCINNSEKHAIAISSFKLEKFVRYNVPAISEAASRYVFKIVESELPNLATTSIDFTTRDEAGTYLVLEKLFSFVKESPKKLPVDSCDLQLAFSRGQPSFIYDKQAAVPENGFYANSEDGKKRFFWESEPIPNWSNQYYRAAIETLAEEMCQMVHGSSACSQARRVDYLTGT